MRKTAIMGVLGAMMGISAQSRSNVYEISNPRSERPKPQKRSSPYGWRFSSPSEHFGGRSKIVTAIRPNGETKRMKLKNALKHNYEFKF